jgi:hypothetical protein
LKLEITGQFSEWEVASANKPEQSTYTDEDQPKRHDPATHIAEIKHGLNLGQALL